MPGPLTRLKTFIKTYLAPSFEIRAALKAGLEQLRQRQAAEDLFRERLFAQLSGLQAGLEQLRQRQAAEDFFRERLFAQLSGLQETLNYDNYLLKLQTSHLKNLDNAVAQLLVDRSLPIYRDLLQTLAAYSVREGHLVRFGNPGDGGYVMLDDFASISIAISCGIKDDVSWDMAMARKGLTVYQYDPTVSLPPGYHAKFSFHKTGIHGGADYAFMPRIAGLHYTTLSSVASEIPGFDKGGNVLKMDIEGFEYETFLEAGSLMPRFDQILLEAHQLERPDYAAMAARIFAGLAKTHALVHIHANNGGIPLIIDGSVIGSVLELTWVRKAGRNFEPKTPDPSSPLDSLNNAAEPAILLRLR